MSHLLLFYGWFAPNLFYNLSSKKMSKAVQKGRHRHQKEIVLSSDEFPNNRGLLT